MLDPIPDRTRTDAPTNRRRRLTSHEKIDLCRGLFAALVVVDHALQVAFVTHPGAKANLPWFVRDAFFSVVNAGTLYVMGFFVISGYCIQQSVGRMTERGKFPVGPYLIARATRILPLYYLALLFACVVESLIANARPDFWPHGVEPSVVVAQLFVVQNLSQTYGSFAPSWSITNEAFYYVYYGLITAVAVKRGWRPAVVGIGACVAVTAVTQGLYITVARNPYVYGVGQLLGLGIIWFLGVLVAVHGKELVESRVVRIVARAWPLVFLSAVVWRGLHLSPHGTYLIPGVAFSLMLLDFLARDRAPNALAPATGDWRSRGVAAFGMTSYPMYLFHGPLMMLASSLIMRRGLIADWRVTWAILVSLGLGSGVALGWLLERPVMAWRSGVLRRLKNGSQVATEPRAQTVTAPVLVLSGVERP